MGAFIAKLWRRKRSTRDVLDKIRKEICDIEEFNQSTHTWHKKLLGYLLAYFSVIYLIAAMVAYFKYFNNPLWRDFTSQLQLMTPFIVAPFIFIFLKRFLTWWYHRKIKRNEVALTKLKEQKAKILDEVMETETYKVAKEILDEFASEGEKRALNVKSPNLNATRSKSVLEASKINDSGMELRKRHTINTSMASAPMVVKAAAAASSEPLTMARPSSAPLHEKASPSKRPNLPPLPRTPVHNASMSVHRPPPGPPLPRPVLPRERGYMDRVVEYLVGDGPHNRYALICRQCQSHNGMALKEEFEYIAYRCCYCHYWNPARKQRPTAPKLEATRPQVSTESSSSEEESESRLLQEDKKVQQPEKPDIPKSHSETNQEVPKVDVKNDDEKEED